MGFMASMITATVTSPATSSELVPGQLVQFRRPSPRGGLGLCRGVVVSVTGGSVVVRCTVSTVIGLPVGAQLRLTVWEVSPAPLSAAVPPLTTVTLREPVRAAREAPAPHGAPDVPVTAGLDVAEVFADPVQRRAARSALAAAQQLVAAAGLTGRFVLARPAMSPGSPREVDYVSADGTATLWVVAQGNGRGCLVVYDGPDGAWSTVCGADGKVLAAALA